MSYFNEFMSTPLGHPTPGPVISDDKGMRATIRLGPRREWEFTDLRELKDLITAATAVAQAWEAEQTKRARTEGPPAPVERRPPYGLDESPSTGDEAVVEVVHSDEAEGDATPSGDEDSPDDPDGSMAAAVLLDRWLRRQHEAAQQE